LPLRHVDTRGSSAHFLDRLQAAAPQASVLLVHAGASDLARLFTRRAMRPVLLAADHPESLTHAYAAMKLLAMRCGLMSYDLLLAAPPAGARLPLIAERLASCAENFLGAALCDWVAIDPACDVRDPPGAALTQLVATQLRLEASGHADDAPAMPGWPVQAPSRSAMNLN
jgi:flagellar biosynthesis protein FlhG